MLENGRAKVKVKRRSVYDWEQVRAGTAKGSTWNRGWWVIPERRQLRKAKK